MYEHICFLASSTLLTVSGLLDFSQSVTPEMIFQPCLFLFSSSSLAFSLIIPLTLLLSVISNLCVVKSNRYSETTQLGWLLPVWNTLLSIMRTAHILTTSLTAAFLPVLSCSSRPGLSHHFFLLFLSRWHVLPHDLKCQPYGDPYRWHCSAPLCFWLVCSILMHHKHLKHNTSKCGALYFYYLEFPPMLLFH